MVTKPKSIGRAMLSAYGNMPSGPDDPRFMTIEDVSKAVDELTAGATSPAQPQSLDDIAEAIWARHNKRA
jgi:hypothetical protein